MSELTHDNYADPEQGDRIEAFAEAFEMLTELDDYLETEFDGDTEVIAEDFEYVHETIQDINELFYTAEVLDTDVEIVTSAENVYVPKMVSPVYQPESFQYVMVPYTRAFPGEETVITKNTFHGVGVHLQKDDGGIHPRLFFRVKAGEYNLPSGAVVAYRMHMAKKSTISFADDPREDLVDISEYESDTTLARHMFSINQLAETYPEYNLTTLRQAGRSINQLLNHTDIGKEHTFQRELAHYVREQLPSNDEPCDIEADYCIVVSRQDDGTVARKIIRRASLTAHIPRTLYCLPRTVLSRAKKPTITTHDDQSGLFMVFYDDEKQEATHVPVEALRRISPAPDQDEDDE